MDHDRVSQPEMRSSDYHDQNGQASPSSGPAASSTAWGSISSDSASAKSSPKTDHHQSDEYSDEGESLDNDEIKKTISRRKSHASGHEGEEWAQIERLISRMFGSERKANSDEEKTRHAGVVWKNLTVKGVGLGAALQPTNGDIFLGLPRLIKGLLTRGRKGASGGKSEVRTILDDFSVCRRRPNGPFSFGKQVQTS